MNVITQENTMGINVYAGKIMLKHLENKKSRCFYYIYNLIITIYGCRTSSIAG